MTTVITAKSTKNLISQTKDDNQFATTSNTYVDVTGIGTLASVINNAIVGIVFSGNKCTASTGQIRLTESPTPANTFAEYTTSGTGINKIVITDTQDSGGTVTLKIQALSNDANFFNFDGQTTTRTHIFSTEFLVLFTAAAGVDTVLPYKISVDVLDVIVLGHGDFRSGYCNGIGTSEINAIAATVLSNTIDNIVTDGFHFATDVASLSALSTGKTIMVIDFTGNKIEVTP